MPIDYEFVIGDPSFMGWFTVFLYFITVICAFLCTFQKFGAMESQQKLFWWFILLLFLFLGFNKQLDLQSFFTELVRYYANRDGWYDDRRKIQVLVISGILLLMVVVIFEVLIRLNKILKENALAVVGVIVLCCFIAIRATSFHHMDLFINYDLLGIKMNWLLEISGILLVMSNALRRIFNKYE